MPRFRAARPEELDHPALGYSAPSQSTAIAEARELLAFIRTNRSWFATGKMIEPYESEAVAKLARWLEGDR